MVAVVAALAVHAGFVGVMFYRDPPPVQFTFLESPATTAGEMIFRREGCLNCHEVFGNGTTYGPTLDGVGSHRTQSWLAEYLRAPREGVGKKPYRVRMPAYAGLPEEEVDALVRYLDALKELDGNGEVLLASASQ